MNATQQRELTGGILLFAAAFLALIFANTPFLKQLYSLLLETYFSVQVGEAGIAKPLILWINDGLMALFFLLVGLEVKREFLEGDLSTPSQIALPAVAALGGMVVPAFAYVLMNWGDPITLQGWAIPVATDIAFVLGVLAILGPRIPNSLRSFLLALAIFDDIGAIAIIAIFYTADLSVLSLIMSGVCLAILIVLNRAGVRNLVPYILIGLVMWVFVLQSGVHATLAGVALGLVIPHRKKHEKFDASPMIRLEHALHPWVVYFVVPVFAFANAGLSFAGMGMDDLVNPITVGIVLGLVLGKQIGIFAFTWAAIQMGWAKMPRATNWSGLYGGAALCGIGFTMSLFISSLAFQNVDIEFFNDSKLGILLGSILAGAIGYYLLKRNGDNAQIKTQ